MRIPTLAKRSLAVALTAALAVPSLVTARDVTGVPLALVAFGESTSSRSDRIAAVAGATPILSPRDIASLGEDVTDHLLATVDASSLPLSPEEAVTLSRMLESGTPVLVNMDGSDAEKRKRVSATFGLVPVEGDFILRRERSGTTVFASSQRVSGSTAALLSALASSAASTLIASDVRMEAHAVSDAAPALPLRRFDVNVVDPEGEISSSATVEVTRSRTASDDFKMISIISDSTINPTGIGIVEGSKPTATSTAALPVKYSVKHLLGTTPATNLTYLDSFPESDARTDFTKSDTETRGYTISGSTGADLSSTGKPDRWLAAKLAFNVGVNYKREWTSNLTTTFKDYLLIARPDGRNSVSWEAPIAPLLRKVLVVTENGLSVELTEKKMTPMMRSAHLPTMSYWKIPGAFEGQLTVSIAAGYDVERMTWEWVPWPVGLKRRDESVNRTVFDAFEFDMSDPYLTAETTVLIRSAVGSSECLRDNDGSVGLAPCLVTDRRQMWGLDADHRYVNRGSGQCLSVQPAARAVVTVGCGGIAFEKQWQWRADRLHSLADAGRYRLYVENGMVHYAAPEGRFADFPVNVNGAPLEPWTNYPAAPRFKTDFVPAPYGAKLEPVPEGYEAFPRVSDEQRWHLQVLRTGL